MLLQILNIGTNPKCCCYLFLVPISVPISAPILVLISVPILESYFIKLFDADLQCEFIRTFFLNFTKLQKRKYNLLNNIFQIMFFSLEDHLAATHTQRVYFFRHRLYFYTIQPFLHFAYVFHLVGES